MARLDDNKKIIRILDKLIDEYPDQRFGQLITNYIFPFYREEDIFFEESSKTLEKLEADFEDLDNDAFASYFVKNCEAKSFDVKKN